MLTKIDLELLKYPDKRSALLPALHLIQDVSGWISESTMETLARLLEIKSIEVKETVSFYSMFNMKPVGNYHFQVCTNISCSLLNSRHIVNYLEKHLKVQSGCTREDMKCSISEVECLGYCGEAPVMMVNDRMYENLNEKQISDLLKSLDLII